MIAILICLFIVTTGAKRSSNKIKWFDSNENTQMQNIFVILPLKHLSIIFLLSQYKEILSPSYLAHVLNTFCFFFLYAKIFIALTMESVITWKKNYKVAHLAWMIFFSCSPQPNDNVENPCRTNHWYFECVSQASNGIRFNKFISMAHCFIYM